MLGYLIQTIIFQLLFLAVYEFLFKKETFFQWNRLYLCVTPLFALVLPFIKIPAFQSTIPQRIAFTLPEVSLETVSATVQKTTKDSGFELTFIEGVFIIGLLFSTIFFLWKLYKIFQLKRKGKAKTYSNTTIIQLPNSTQAFSFINLIFLGENLSETSKKHILTHELVHIKQKHYVDLLFFELLRILFWFNPIIYIYQKQTATLHEYIADAKTASLSDKQTYSQNLLSEVFQTNNISFINTFFNHSLIKKRIVMLQKTESKKTKLVKYALLIPVLVGMLFYTSCSKEKESSSEDSSITEKIEILKTALENNEGELTNSESTMLNDLLNSVTLEVEELESLPFSVIDQAPVYPGCEHLNTNEERKKCMSESISLLIRDNFDSSIGKKNGLTERQRIAVQFKIDADGNVKDVLSRAAHPDFEKEAQRVMSLLPKMQPGKQDGKEVNVLYSLPIVFEIESEN